MLKDLKDLEKAIKLCRKLGVDTIEIGDIKFQLAQEPVRTVTRAVRIDTPTAGMSAPGGITEDVQIPTTPGFAATGLTEEQMLFYSAGSSGNEQ